MTRRLINISLQALAVNEQMLGSLIKTMNLSSKVNSLKLQHISVDIILGLLNALHLAIFSLFPAMCMTQRLPLNYKCVK